MKIPKRLLGLALYLSVVLQSLAAYADPKLNVPTPGGKSTMQSIVLGGGCFWCIEAVFQRLIGIEKVESGYAGGQKQSPTYEDVSSGSTGHAEVVRLEFDSQQISLKEILEVFFHLHDPTTKNRQGADIGTQYRSIILYENDQQKKDAEEVIRKITGEKLWKDPIVTEVVPLKEYFPAEGYHQNYYNQNKTQGYCSIVIGPKIKKLEQEFAAKLKPAK